MRQVLSAVLLCSATLACANIFASTCPIGNPDWYNGSCIDGLVAGSYPYFETDVDVTWDKAKSTLTASYTKDGISLFHVSSNEQFAITNTKFDFSATLLDFHAPSPSYTGNVVSGSAPDKAQLTISGDMTIGGTAITKDLMSAYLEGVYGQDGKLIGFNTTGIICNPVIDAYVNCTTDEVIYFDLASEIDFTASTSTKKAKGKTLTSGTALTSVPLPPTVWLFGSGLLGLVGIAKSRKTA